MGRLWFVSGVMWRGEESVPQGLKPALSRGMRPKAEALGYPEAKAKDA